MRRLLSKCVVTLAMCVSIGLGVAGCTPSDAPPTGEPMGGPDRASQEHLRQEEGQR